MERPRVLFRRKVKLLHVFFASVRRAASRIFDAFASRVASIPCRLAMLVFMLGLCGCSASRVIDLYAADYRDTAATAGDAQLLMNILRAKDNLPIHFSDLSIIHGSIQLTAGTTATLPFAHFTGSQTPSSIGPTLNAQSSPTFDVGTLDTQDFTKGILKPIEPAIINQLFAQGVDPRIIMILFFSQYKKLNGETFLNNMACDYTHPLKEGVCYNHIYDFLHEVDGIFRGTDLGTFTKPGFDPSGRRAPLQANIYVELAPVGGPLTGPWTLADNLGDLSGMDTAKFKLEGKQLYSISDPHLAICYYERDHKLHSLFPSEVGDAACNQYEVKVFHPRKINAGLTVRSTYEMLQFLGQVLRFQEEKGNNRCLTLGPGDRHCDTGEVLFQVNAPVGTPVVTTRYGDASYALYDRSCNKIREDACDYSLEVLAILELLLNANKAASQIPSTPRVQFVP